jgi:hypothetical protein
MTDLPQPKASRFASGAAVKLPLSDGDWVLVRAELSYAQQRRLAAAGLSGVPDVLAEPLRGRELTVDLAQYDLERLATWLLDWSFRDADGDKVVVSREAIEQLTPETGEEINAALSQYIAESAAKKAMGAGGPNRPGPTSSSASGSGGPGTS